MGADDENWSLTDERLAEVLAMVKANPCPRCAVCMNEEERTRFALYIIGDKALTELQSYRAMVKRLDEWAEELDGLAALDEGGAIRVLAVSAELRNRMKGG